jgi:UDP-N-acetylmuramoylalanine--D-glutamate ligase
MRIGIVGYGVEGKSAEKYWSALGHDITILDTTQDLTGYDMLVRSPSVHPNKLPEGAKVTTVTSEFFAKCPVPIIGVTGTKGKGTTSTLITEMLRAAGKTVHLGGNIGVSALDLLPDIKADDVVVLELSSYQLMDVKKSPHISVCLMLAPEHLDYHTDEQEYWDAKGNIFAHQEQTDVAIYNHNDQMSTDLAYTSSGTRIPYDVTGSAQEGSYVLDGQIWYQDTPICKTSDVALLGAHNLQNVCAAVSAAWQVTNDVAALKTAISAFTGLPYRLQDISTVNGVRYINDSFGTTPEATYAAIDAFAEPELLILGGYDKKISFTDMAQKIVKSQVKAVTTMGQTAEQIESELKMAGYPEDQIRKVETLQEAVEHLAQIAEPGDVVLLSPACASWDMFENYKQRAEQFNQAVRDLA